jgi:hypothetical protein
MWARAVGLKLAACDLPTVAFLMERVMGIEPTSSAWKAEVLPLNYTRPSYDPSCNAACGLPGRRRFLPARPFIGRTAILTVPKFKLSAL